MITILATLFVLGILIFIHEFGHFISAKLFHMRVDTFSLGFPPRMIGKKIGETDYCISWIPLGGYCKIAGMVDESFDTKQLESEPKPWEFRSKPYWQRVLVIIAGPLMNFILPFLLFTGFALQEGIPQYDKTIIGEVLPDKPADISGMLPGDEIVTINGDSVHTWIEMAEIIHESIGDSLDMGWIRNESLITKVIFPVQDVYNNNGAAPDTLGIIGIRPARDFGLIQCLQSSSNAIFHLSKTFLGFIGKLIIGQESIRNVAGPVGISRLAGESAREGFDALLIFLAIISVNLAVINLLPVPVLDGGHILLLLIEAIIRRPIPVRVKLMIQQIFMVLLLIFIAFVIYNDIVRWVAK